jgi:hypothetical protein
MIFLLICKERTLLPSYTLSKGEGIRGKRDKPSIPIRRRRKILGLELSSPPAIRRAVKPGLLPGQDFSPSRARTT